MDPFMETNTYNVSTAVWKDSPRTVINSLFLTVLGHSLHTAVSTAVWRECHRTVRNRLLMTVLGLSFLSQNCPSHLHPSPSSHPSSHPS
ncbi:unnamed protein product, partial [Staurois parvus]